MLRQDETYKPILDSVRASDLFNFDTPIAALVEQLRPETEDALTVPFDRTSDRGGNA
jgi:hypothetical protein